MQLTASFLASISTSFVYYFKPLARETITAYIVCVLSRRFYYLTALKSANDTSCRQLLYSGTQGRIQDFLKRGGVDFCKGRGVTIHCLITKVSWVLASYIFSYVLAHNGDDLSHVPSHLPGSALGTSNMAICLQCSRYHKVFTKSENSTSFYVSFARR